MTRRPIECGIVFATALAFLAAPAGATNMLKHNAGQGCVTLVTAAHPDVKGAARRAEIKKCKADPDGYNKASGF